MSEVKNLLDMFLNTRKDAQAKSAKAPQAGGLAPKARETDAKGSLLPIETGTKNGAPAKAKSASGSSLSFQARVKESSAKLEAKAGHDSQSARSAQADKAFRSKAVRDAHKNDDDPHADIDRAARARQERSDRPDAARTRSRKAARRDDPPSSEGMDNTDVTARADVVRKAAPAKGDAEAAPGALDAEAVEALKEGLKKIGIDADDEQLLDPEFLDGILQMLQALPLQTATDAQTAPEETTDMAVAGATDSPAAPAVATSVGAAAEAVPAQVDVQAVTADVPGPETVMPEIADAKTGSDGTAQAAVSIPADMLQTAESGGPALSRKELVALLSKQIEALKGQESRTTGEAAAPASAAAAPSAWQGVKIQDGGDTAADDLPMADLDRLRVTQSASFQAGHAGASIESAPADEETGESRPVDSIGETAHEAASTERDSGSAGNGGLSEDSGGLPGRNGEGFGGPDGSGRNQGATASKDGAGIPHFQANLEQARPVDHRAGVQRAWEPRPAFDNSALEQIAKKMSAIGRKDGDAIDIQLSPEHLGKVRVSLEMKEGGMSARIAVESDHVRKQVEDGLASLKDALANQGIKLQGLEVSVDQRHGSLFNPDGSNAESFFHRQHRGGNGGNEAAQEVAPFESAPETDTGRRWGYNTMEYIG
jgi:flagellar hook-length control protein FliK